MKLTPHAHEIYIFIRLVDNFYYQWNSKVVSSLTKSSKIFCDGMKESKDFSQLAVYYFSSMCLCYWILHDLSSMQANCASSSTTMIDSSPNEVIIVRWSILSAHAPYFLCKMHARKSFSLDARRSYGAR